MKTVHLAAAAVLALAPMTAQAVTATIGGTPTAVPPSGSGAGKNDFIAELTAALGGSLGFVTSGTISLSAPGTLIFTEVAAESGFDNAFTDGTNTMTETGNFGFGANFLTSGGETFSKAFGAGAVSGLEFTSTGSGSLDAALGEGGFGIFYDATKGLTGHTVFFLAYDDNGASEDDNHDDYIVRVQVVPAPLGALLIGTAFLAAGAVRRFGRKAA